MKYLFLNILLLFVIENLYSQTGWITQASGVTTNLNSVKFINSQTGWCVGDSGVILNTVNRGLNWTQQFSGYDNNLNSIHFTSINTGYVAGNSGLILKTTDSGNNWMILSFNSNNNLTSINFVNDSTGFTGGTNGNGRSENDGTPKKFIYKTTNYGNLWDSIDCKKAFFITYVYFQNPNLGWIVNFPGVIGGSELLKTTDSGFNWHSSFFTNQSIFSFVFVDSLYGWISSYNSVSVKTIFRTTNGGINWISEFPGTGIRINSFHFINRLKGWGAGENRIIQSTTNSGINWINQTSLNPGVNYRSVYFTDSLTGWVVGDSGIILKTTTGGVLTNFSNISSEIPDKFSLSQNFPNPFNPRTIINYQLSMFSFVSIKVYDVLGNEVVELVNEKQNAGSYSVEFDGSGFASGIYFYRLETGSFVDTKKMTLIK